MKSSAKLKTAKILKPFDPQNLIPVEIYGYTLISKSWRALLRKWCGIRNWRCLRTGWLITIFQSYYYNSAFSCNLYWSEIINILVITQSYTEERCFRISLKVQKWTYVLAVRHSHAGEYISGKHFYIN